ncbi:hypothetical protein ZIOFF_048883 [Zingiber officinale]|uniref:Bulb-type lectin domain-containing protein n=1 Tax=Zingiber officinale TaxID=94328 RepID=A0A8J5KUN1_ZINOF|nr:hypothetical protein ZIOFF_048883 [Zingiber officinale]
MFLLVTPFGNKCYQKTTGTLPEQKAPPLPLKAKEAYSYKPRDIKQKEQLKRKDSSSSSTLGIVIPPSKNISALIISLGDMPPKTATLTRISKNERINQSGSPRTDQESLHHLREDEWRRQEKGKAVAQELVEGLEGSCLNPGIAQTSLSSTLVPPHRFDAGARVAFLRPVRWAAASVSLSANAGDRVVLLNSSNLQVQKLATAEKSDMILWQSFDFPSDTLVQSQNFYLCKRSIF